MAEGLRDHVKALLQLNLSRPTSSREDPVFQPNTVRRQIEAIRRKHACAGIGLFLSSERGLIG